MRGGASSPPPLRVLDRNGRRAPASEGADGSASLEAGGACGVPSNASKVAKGRAARNGVPPGEACPDTDVAGLVRSDVRAFLDLMPIDEAPAILDDAKLQRLLGEIETTPYDAALPVTLDWLAGRADPTGA